MSFTNETFACTNVREWCSHGEAFNGSPWVSLPPSRDFRKDKQAIDVTRRSTNRRCSYILPFRVQNTGFHRSHGPQQPRGDLIIFARRSSCLNTVIYSQLHSSARRSAAPRQSVNPSPYFSAMGFHVIPPKCTCVLKILFLHIKIILFTDR